MSAVFTKGDLFNHKGLKGLAHGCNCAGAMGAGIAVEFKKRYPDMFVEYKRRCADGRFVLGTVLPWKAGALTVYNLATEQHWRTGADLNAIEQAVAAMVELAASEAVTPIGLPRIGAGYGGLRWDDVKAVLSKAGESATVELVVFEEFVKGA